LCSGFYSEWVSSKLKKEIFKTDMLRLSFNYDKKMLTEKQDDFIKELFFSAIMKARIFGESYADFQFEWAISEYVCGFIFHSDKSVMRMYENLEKKYVLMFDRDRFFIEDSFFDFIGGCDE
jgi:hypothetical protein